MLIFKKKTFRSSTSTLNCKKEQLKNERKSVVQPQYSEKAPMLFKMTSYQKMQLNLANWIFWIQENNLK